MPGKQSFEANLPEGRNEALPVAAGIGTLQITNFSTSVKVAAVAGLDRSSTCIYISMKVACTQAPRHIILCMQPKGLNIK